jgi:hypothetical protein
MATITSRLDDLTGETLPEDTPTTTLRINDPRGDVSIALDLSDTSFKGLLKAVDKYVSKGAPIALPTTARAVGTDTEAREFARAARQWAIATNLQPPVADRGQVPQHALDAYRAHLAGQGEEQPDGPTTEEERKSASDE